MTQRFPRASVHRKGTRPYRRESKPQQRETSGEKSHELNSGLSPDKQQLLERLSQGLTNREIACGLVLTRKMARGYARDWRRKRSKQNRITLFA